MRKCRFCHEDIPDAAAVCPHCGRDLIPGRTTVPETAAAPAVVGPAWSVQGSEIEKAAVAPTPIARVSVVDVNMPFASMVGFMIKWAIAAIPAVIILSVIGLLLTLAFAALGLFSSR